MSQLVLLGASGLNVQQMTNDLFTGEVAAVASINLERIPDAKLLEQLETDADILAVSISDNSQAGDR